MATKLIGVSIMKVNEITEGYYDASPFAQKMARYGRTLQQIGQGTGKAGSLKKQKGEDDKAYDARLNNMNKMGSVGAALTSIGSSFGIKDPSESGPGTPKEKLAKMFADIEQASGASKAEIMKMIQQAEAKGDMKSNVPDPEPQNDEPEDEPDDVAPSDDEIDRDAKDFARGQ